MRKRLLATIVLTLVCAGCGGTTTTPRRQAGVRTPNLVGKPWGDAVNESRSAGDDFYAAPGAGATAARPPRLKEREAIVHALPAKIRNTPVECLWLIVRVSSRDRRYASVGGAFMNWEKPGSRCLSYTDNGGLMILKKKRRWRIIFAGTMDPPCSLEIPRDLIGCRNS